jgi:hypothetical protein
MAMLNNQRVYENHGLLRAILDVSWRVVWMESFPGGRNAALGNPNHDGRISTIHTATKAGIGLVETWWILA